MACLPDDVWVQIGLHLNPRHLTKMLATNKRIKRLLDNKTYWSRVAFHLFWRDNEYMELVLVYPEQADHLVLPTPDGKFYDMSFIPRGYKWGMDQFIQRVHLCAQLYPLEFPFWNDIKDLPIHHQAVASCKYLKAKDHDLLEDDSLSSIKHVVRLQYQQSSEVSRRGSIHGMYEIVHRLITGVIQNVDEDTMSIPEKQRMVMLLERLSCNVYQGFIAGLSCSSIYCSSVHSFLKNVLEQHRGVKNNPKR